MAASLEFATPREICGLRALVDHASGHAEHVMFDCPNSDDVHRYLTRMDFYANLPLNVALSRDVPVLHRQDRRRNLIELRRISTADDLETLLDRVWVVAQEQFGAGSLAKACAIAIGAATENVLDHAGSPAGALVAAQRYKSTGLELCVVDIGHGIPFTLRRNPEYADLTDVEAVARALDDGVTGTGAPGRGAGLNELVRTISRAGDAALSIQSAQASLQLTCRLGNRQIRQLTPQCPVPGTWLSVRLQPTKPNKKETSWNPKR
jgi:anti-sigma regulatory factor (Ser/Thr protein kinase)